MLYRGVSNNNFSLVLIKDIKINNKYSGKWKLVPTLRVLVNFSCN